MNSSIARVPRLWLAIKLDRSSWLVDGIKPKFKSFSWLLKLRLLYYLVEGLKISDSVLIFWFLKSVYLFSNSFQWNTWIGNCIDTYCTLNGRIQLLLPQTLNVAFRSFEPHIAKPFPNENLFAAIFFFLNNFSMGNGSAICGSKDLNATFNVGG